MARFASSNSTRKGNDVLLHRKQQQLITETEAILAGEPAGKFLDGQPVGDITDPAQRRAAIDVILAPCDLCVDWDQEFWEGQHVVPKSRYPTRDDVHLRRR